MDDAEMERRVDEAESRAAEMERRYDELAVAMHVLAAASDAEIARLTARIRQMGGRKA